MNRRQRRAKAAMIRVARARHAAVTAALEMLRTSPEDVTSATLVLPDGEVLHFSAEVARAVARAKGSRH